MRPAAPPSSALRIIDQERVREGFAYEFALDEQRLTITIGPSPEPTRWRVEAKGRLRATEVRHSVTAEAATRVDAVRAAAVEWAKDTDRRLAFDWQAIETLLGGVKAL
ncbi:MAG: hypothetical protein HOW73_44860 [Polyangiaceae bacterium]|nr:hypothetical protein [Polyangiaceae bacterium]